MTFTGIPGLHTTFSVVATVAKVAIAVVDPIGSVTVIRMKTTSTWKTEKTVKYVSTLTATELATSTLAQTNLVGAPAAMLDHALSTLKTTAATRSTSSTPSSKTGFSNSPDPELHPLDFPHLTAPKSTANFISVITTETDWFVGNVLPSLVAAVLLILWKVVSLEVESMEPFYQMNLPNGATGHKSIFLDFFDGWQQFVVPILALRRRHYVVAVTSSVELLSAIIGPLAAEAISMGLIGICAKDSAKGCATIIRVSALPTRALQGLMVVIVVLGLSLLILMARRKYGVTNDPRSIFGITLLASDRSLGLLKKVAAVDPGLNTRGWRQKLGELRFKLSQDESAASKIEILPCRQSDSFAANSPDRWEFRCKNLKRCLDSQSFSILRYWVTVSVFLAFHMALVVMLGVYSVTSGETPFERFMAGQSFGVQFLFSMLGVLVSFGWLSLFKGKKTFIATSFFPSLDSPC